MPLLSVLVFYTTLCLELAHHLTSALTLGINVASALAHNNVNDEPHFLHT